MMDILACSGRVNEFYYIYSDFYQPKIFGGPQWSLPWSNPFYVATIVCFCGSMVLAPVFYAVIYK